MIKQLTPSDQIYRYAMREIEKRNQGIIRALQYIGEACVAKAREDGSYQDQTGNLRNSIAYIVLQDGVPVSSGGSPEQGSAGAQEAEKFMKQLITENSGGIVLLVVAGMKYAEVLESRNYDVLTSAELLAESMVPKLLTRLGGSAR